MANSSNHDEAAARAVIVRLLARREYSRHELAQRLSQRGFSAAVSDAALEKAEAAGWQSDERYVEAFVRSRVQRCQGPLKITAQLRQRGVDDHLIRRGLSHAGVDWAELACDYLQRHPRYRGEPLKARQALHRRGYDGTQARQAIASAWSDEDEPALD
ncbi:MAG: hypothetical protein Tsb002_36720 [Wenzhouxiangellaceae bacterium]